MKLSTIAFLIVIAASAALGQQLNADEKKIDGPRYQVKHVWGEGAHSDEHGGVLLPEILRWMWE